MASRSRYMLQVVLRGLRAPVYSQGSAVTSSRGLLLLRPELRLLSCSHGLRRAARPNTGDRHIPLYYVLLYALMLCSFVRVEYTLEEIYFSQKFISYFLSHDHLPFFYWFPLVCIFQRWTAASHT